MRLGPWRGHFHPFDEMERWLEEGPRFPHFHFAEEKFAPEMNISEDDGNIIVETSLPGVEPSKVNVTVEDDRITIEGSTEKKVEEKRKGYYRKEISSGSFYRQARLPQEVEKDKSKAEWENGILRVTIPKAKPEKKGKKVAIKVKTR